MPLREPAADPNLSATGPGDDCPTSFDSDPADRCLDRTFARLGLLDDAAPLFRDGGRVPRAGVLLAVPALVRSGILDVARRVYGSIGPAIYGLRTTVVALLLLALLRRGSRSTRRWTSSACSGSTVLRRSRRYAVS